MNTLSNFQFHKFNINTERNFYKSYEFKNQKNSNTSPNGFYKTNKNAFNNNRYRNYIPTYFSQEIPSKDKMNKLHKLSHDKYPTKNIINTDFESILKYGDSNKIDELLPHMIYNNLSFTKNNHLRLGLSKFQILLKYLFSQQQNLLNKNNKIETMFNNKNSNMNKKIKELENEEYKVNNLFISNNMQIEKLKAKIIIYKDILKNNGKEFLIPKNYSNNISNRNGLFHCQICLGKAFKTYEEMQEHYIKEHYNSANNNLNMNNNININPKNDLTKSYLDRKLSAFKNEVKDILLNNYNQNNNVNNNKLKENKNNNNIKISNFNLINEDEENKNINDHLNRLEYEQKEQYDQLNKKIIQMKNEVFNELKNLQIQPQIINVNNNTNQNVENNNINNKINNDNSKINLFNSGGVCDNLENKQNKISENNNNLNNININNTNINNNLNDININQKTIENDLSENNINKTNLNNNLNNINNNKNILKDIKNNDSDINLNNDMKILNPNFHDLNNNLENNNNINSNYINNINNNSNNIQKLNDNKFIDNNTEKNEIINKIPSISKEIKISENNQSNNNSNLNQEKNDDSQRDNTINLIFENNMKDSGNNQNNQNNQTNIFHSTGKYIDKSKIIEEESNRRDSSINNVTPNNNTNNQNNSIDKEEKFYTNTGESIRENPIISLNQQFKIPEQISLVQNPIEKDEFINKIKERDENLLLNQIKNLPEIEENYNIVNFKNENILKQKEDNLIKERGNKYLSEDNKNLEIEDYQKIIKNIMNDNKENFRKDKKYKEFFDNLINKNELSDFIFKDMKISTMDVTQSRFNPEKNDFNKKSGLGISKDNSVIKSYNFSKELDFLNKKPNKSDREDSL